MEMTNYDYNTQELRYAGHGDRLDEQLKIKMGEGLPEFYLEERQYFESPFEKETAIDFYPQFGRDHVKERYYMNGTLAVMAKEILIPLTKDKDTNDLIKQLSGQLSVPPSNIMGSPDQVAFEQTIAQFNAAVSNDLLILRDRSEQVFNRFVAKYSPDLNFSMTEDQLAAQQKIREDALIMQFFPRREHLSTELMGALMMGNWVYQHKFSKDSKEVKGWIQINFQADKTEFGNHPYNRVDESMGFDPGKKLMEYAFAQTANAYKVAEMVVDFKRGKWVAANPIESQRYREVYLRVNPTRKTYDIRSINGSFLTHDQFKHEQYRRQLVEEAEMRVVHRNFSSSIPSSSIIEQHYGVKQIKESRSAPAGDGGKPENSKKGAEAGNDVASEKGKGKSNTSKEGVEAEVVRNPRRQKQSEISEPAKGKSQRKGP